LICCVLSVARGVIAFVMLGRALRTVSVSETHDALRVPLTISLIIGATLDTLLTGTVSHYLRKRKQRY